jgi:ankyrin repeat protein
LLGRRDAAQAFGGAEAARLAKAAGDGRAGRVRALVAAGADPNRAGEDGITPLQWAILRRSPRGASALLQAGADPARPGWGGRSALHLAAMAADPRHLALLLRHAAADLDVPHARTGESPLQHALAFARTAQATALIEAGASVHHTDRLGNTPLHTAALAHRPDDVLALLDRGADPLARNAAGLDFRAYLAIGPQGPGHDRVARWLREHGVGGA